MPRCEHHEAILSRSEPRHHHQWKPSIPHWFLHGFLLLLTLRSTDARTLNPRIARSLSDQLGENQINWDDVPTETFFLVDSEYSVNHNTSFYNYTGYNSFEPIKSEMYRLQDKHPDIVTVEVIGRSHEGRDLLAMHINKNHSDNVVFLGSLVHAREWVTGCVVMEIINKLLNSASENTEESQSINTLLDTYHFIIMPVYNPDGYEYTFTTNRLWRKNREPIPGYECKGTDVNRNFLYGYKPYNEDVDNATERGPCSDSYPGRRSLSTKEAHAINRLMTRYKRNMKYYADFHMYGNDFVYSYGDTLKPPKNEEQLYKFGSNAVNILRNMTNQEWKTGSVADVIYKCKGIMVDHVHFYITPISYTIEVGPPETSFRAPDFMIEVYTQSQWAALLSNLLLLKEDIHSDEYQIQKTRNWRLTNMV